MRGVLCALLLVVIVGTFSAEILRADEALTGARQLADVEGRYDEAEQAYLKLLDGPEVAAVAAELAGLYERLGEIDAAARMYERAVAEGRFAEPVTRRLETRLQWCRRQRASLVRFPVSVEAEADVQQAEAMLQAQQWPAAFTTLANLLEKFSGTFRQRQPGLFLGIWQWARSTLDELPDAGRSAYLEWSGKHWAEALADGSIEALQGFVRDHPASAASGPAVLAWADTLADQGRFARALGLIAREGIDAKAAELRRERWQRHLAGGTASQAGDDNSVSHRPRLDQIIAQLDRGWSIPLNADEDAGAIGLAAGGGRFFVYRDFQVNAFDSATGAWLWGYAPTEPADRHDLRREIHSRSKRPEAKWAGAIDPPAIAVCPAGVLIVETYDRGDIDHVYCVVTCLRPESGRARWRLAADPLLEKLRVCGTPVYSGGKVLVTAASRGEYPEYWLCALDAEDGQLLWRVRIAAGATPTRCIGRGVLHAGQSGPTLTCDGETVYYATHMGAVVAVDRDLGQPLWAVSYPRVARFGPMTTAPLTLLERKTQAIHLTSKYLVLLPRDLNALLVIDRATGELRQTIRSLDLLAVVDATDTRAVVTTLSGEVRAYSLADGLLAWSWRPPASATGDLQFNHLPVTFTNDEIVVPHGRSITRLDPATGSPVSRHEIETPTALRPVGPQRQWVAITANAIRVLNGEPRTVEPPPPSPIIADAHFAPRQQPWSHDAYLPARGATARLVPAGKSAMLIVAGRSGIAAYDPANRYVRRWWRQFDAEQGVWAGSIVDANKANSGSVIAVSDDREMVALLDAVTGQQLAAGTVEGVSPIRALHVVGEHVLVAGTSMLAGVTIAGMNSRGPAVREGRADTAEKVSDGRTGGLRTLWQHEVTPRVFEAILPGDPVTSVLVQPGGGEPARLIRIDSRTGSIEASFVVAAPLAEISEHEEDREDRYPVGRLTYKQAQLQKDEQGYRVAGGAGGGDIRLHPGPIRLMDRRDELAFFEMLYYWGIVKLATGQVALMSPPETGHDATAETREQQLLIEWLHTHPGHDRSEELEFSFDAFGLRFVEQGCPLAVYEEDQLRCGWLVDSSERRTALGNLRPQHIDVIDPWLMVSGEAGTLVLRHRSEAPSPAITAPSGKAASPETPARCGKDPADLFEPPGVEAVSTEGLVLDGDLADWPADAWQVMTPERHTWPCIEVNDSSQAAAAVTLKAAFQWAMGESAVWLALRVEDEVLSSDSVALPADGDRVEVMLVGRQWAQSPRDPDRTPPLPVVISMTLADNVPVAYLRSPEYPLTVARPAGMAEQFDLWLHRRYSWQPRVEEAVVLAARGQANLTTYELRIERPFFKTGEPTTFDLRISDDDGAGITGCLEWGGAVYDPAVCPLAPLRNTGRSAK